LQLKEQSAYPRHIRDALAPYLLHSQVPLSEESTALIRSKCIPGMVRASHGTPEKTKQSTTQNKAIERKSHANRIEKNIFPYICTVTKISN